MDSKAQNGSTVSMGDEPMLHIINPKQQKRWQQNKKDSKPKNKCFACQKYQPWNCSSKLSKLLRQILRTDNGIEYCNKKVHDILQQRKIIHQPSTPRTLEQNEHELSKLKSHYFSEHF
uniref:Uncharacterized protein n=1 Tax=Glossina pallidipes TaxID=7398 RepID=A0A1B0A3R0_GLOPL